MPHIHEKIDFTASVYIVNGDAVFLHLHKKTGHWLPVGGHVEPGEDPNETALREVREEAGLDIELVGDRSYFGEDKKERDLLPPRFLNRHFFKLGEAHEHVDFTYFARSKNRDARPEEDTEYKWFTKEDLERADLLPRIRFAALTALNEIGS